MVYSVFIQMQTVCQKKLGELMTRIQDGKNSYEMIGIT
jgi:hypothetical protein